MLFGPFAPPPRGGGIAKGGGLQGGTVVVNHKPPNCAPGAFFFPVQTKGEPAYLVHQMVLETTSRNQGPELSGATMIPQMTVVVDLTCNGDWLSLKPGDAVGDCNGTRRHAPSSICSNGAHATGPSVMA